MAAKALLFMGCNLILNPKPLHTHQMSVSISGSSVGVGIPIPEIPGLEVDVSYNFQAHTFTAAIEEGWHGIDVSLEATNMHYVNGQIVGALPPPSRTGNFSPYWYLTVLLPS